jgi:peptidoglycan/xylan/chitin deacetylase (PgdA/CDA1 family)
MACVATGTLRLVHRLSIPSIVILRYHSVQEDPDKFATTIGTDCIHAVPVFERHMELLARRFSPISMDDVLSFLEGGRLPPRRAVVVTLDDGFKDNFQVAAPILNRFAIPATFYVLVDSVDRSTAPWYCRLRHMFLTSRNPNWTDRSTGTIRELKSSADRYTAFLAATDLCAGSSLSVREEYMRHAEEALDPKPFPAESELMMTWDEARALIRSGHTVGAHTMTHPNLAHIGIEEARSELGDSKRRLQNELGQSVRHFSYPSPALNPHWNETTLRLTVELGYSTAVTTVCGAVRRGANPFILPRTYVPREELEFTWNTERTFLQHPPSVSRQLGS